MAEKKVPTGNLDEVPRSRTETTVGGIKVTEYRKGAVVPDAQITQRDKALTASTANPTPNDWRSWSEK